MLTDIPDDARGWRVPLYASGEERRALKAVVIFRKLISVWLEKQGVLVYSIGISNIHEHFPPFAWQLGLSGPLFENSGGNCPAITLHERMTVLRECEITRWAWYTCRPIGADMVLGTALKLARDIGALIGVDGREYLLQAVGKTLERIKESEASQATA